MNDETSHLTAGAVAGVKAAEAAVSVVSNIPAPGREGGE